MRCVLRNHTFIPITSRMILERKAARPIAIGARNPGSGEYSTWIGKHMDGDYNVIAEELIRRAAKQERRLLSREAEAEVELKRALERQAPAEKRLRRAEDEFERRARVVARAESALLACQAARAAGPNVEPSLSETPPPVVVDAPRFTASASQSATAEPYCQGRQISGRTAVKEAGGSFGAARSS